ncbi:hypothetical protein [Burkholderia pseudomallei]|uniref:hypothetical protein n=1 Tax=Burkholderia pseudomallei TaxID=28450 RepID=UPI0029554AE6|nr:hypothetical protein [Burkholderia pseudomallei]
MFYTVIPLYQKAAVDEQLARRETELKVVEANMQRARMESYRLRRDDLLRALSLRTGDDCSGVPGIVMQPSDIDEPKALRRRRAVTLDINVESCIEQHVGDPTVARALSRDDLASLKTRSKSLATELEASRQEAIRTIAVLPEAAKTDPSRLDPVGAFVARMDNFVGQYVRSIGSEQRTRETNDRFNYRVQITQERIAMDYRLNVSKRLVSELEPEEWKADRIKAPAPRAALSSGTR